MAEAEEQRGHSVGAEGSDRGSGERVTARERETVTATRLTSLASTSISFFLPPFLSLSLALSIGGEKITLLTHTRGVTQQPPLHNAASTAEA